MRWLFLVLGILIGVPAGAQTVQVRSGEHDGFSRLVLRLPGGTDWSVNRTGRTARIETDRDSIRFDTDEVFQLIPRDRLLSVSQEKPGGPLDLSLNCDCEIVPSTMGGGYLILDIRDAEDAAPPLPTVFALGTRTPYRFGASFGSPRNSTAHASGPPSLPADPKLPATKANPKAAVIGNMISEQRLMAQIDRAAAQGLLEPKSRNVRKDIPAVAKPAPPEEKPVGEPVRRYNTKATTVIDRDLSGLADQINAYSGVEGCIASSDVALSDWATALPFSAQVSAQRALLYGEFDRLNAKATTTLAKIYLHFGFGAEAQLLLDQLPPDETRVPLLMTLADILDDRDTAERPSLRGQENCTGDIAMWVALAHPDLAGDLDADSVFQGFTRLPVHLRRQLGARLSQSVTEAGSTELAGAILRAMDRAADKVEPDVVLAEARIETKQGQPDDAAEKMLEVVDSGSDYTPEALIELVDTRLKDQKPLRPDLPDLAVAYAEEFRLSDLGADLRRTSAISLSMAGRFDEAAAHIRKLREIDGPGAELPASIPFFDLLNQNAGDVTFLSHVLVEVREPTVTLPPALQTRIAARLLELGFAEQALGMLEQIVAPEHPESRRILRAKAALEIDLPHRAMIEVMSLDSAEASDIRSRAMQMNGDFKQAGLLQSESGQYEDAARNFWLGDAPAALPDDEGAGRYARLAELTQLITEQTDIEETAPSLATARRFLDDSEMTRERIGELLGSVPTGPDAN